MKGSGMFIKLFTAFMVLTLLLIGGIWFMQNQFLEGFYYQRTIEALEESGEEIMAEIHRREEEEGVESLLEEESRILGTEIALFSLEGELLYETGIHGHMPMMGRGRRTTLDEASFNKLEEEGVLSLRETEDSHRGPMGHRTGERDILNTYVLREGLILRLQTTLNPIQQGIDLTQDFYLWILLFGGILAFILSLLFSKRIARPIENLTEVAKEMNRMNFDVRYTGAEKGEIGELGNTLNHLTGSLKETIDQLQQELEKEKNLKNLRREFIARVSHELKTPIAVIKGYAEALEDGVYRDEKEKEDYLHILQEESMKMDRMLREILDLSRLETRHMELKEEPVEIISFTERVMEKLKAIDPSKNLVLVSGLQNPKTLIKGDGYRLEQILSNFIKNAMEHGEGQDVEIRVLESKERGGSLKEEVRIEIKNQGSPLPKEEQEKIWESFYKTSETKGSGLGLSIAAGILQLMGSNFGTYNEATGVVFYFTLEKLKE